MKKTKKTAEEPTNPGAHMEPDERDAKIAELERMIYNLTMANKELSRAAGAVASPPNVHEASLRTSIAEHKTAAWRTGPKPHDLKLYAAAGLK